MLIPMPLPKINGMTTFEFTTSYNRSVYIAGHTVDEARDYAKCSGALMWDETIKKDSGKIAVIGIYVNNSVIVC